MKSADELPMRANPRRRRRWRRIVAASVLLYVVPVTGGCMNPSLPFDLLLNLSSAPVLDDCRADPATPTLVVLQHGLFRSWGSLWRLERALEQHGYEVLNFSYPSTRALIEDHAARLRDALEQRIAERGGAPARLCFVGHSMGGLVIRAYLARDDARRADACVFLGTPQRGAVLADARHERFTFRLFLGDKAALQLRPGAPIYATLGRVPCASIGTIRGASGEPDGGNDDIPGDDDGTVGVDEAQLAEQTASVELRCGHTLLSCAEEPIRAVLRFLRHGDFAAAR